MFATTHPLPARVTVLPDATRRFAHRHCRYIFSGVDCFGADRAELHLP